MADDRHHFAQPHGHVAMDDLAVIDITLKFQLGDLKFDDQVAREAKIVEEVAGHVARIDRLDHDVEAMGLKKLGGPYHRLVKRRHGLRIAALGNAGHQMQAFDAGRLRIGQRRLNTLLQVGKTIRQRRKTLFAGVPIAWRQVEQRLGQAVAAQPLANGLRGMFIGKQEFNGRESRPGRFGKAVEEWHFVEHHAEIGGETGHRLSSFFVHGYFGSPGKCVPVTRAYIRATEASSSRPMPEAAVIKNICSAAAATGTGNLADRAMSWTMPRSLTKISTALRGL